MTRKTIPLSEAFRRFCIWRIAGFAEAQFIAELALSRGLDGAYEGYALPKLAEGERKFREALGQTDEAGRIDPPMAYVTDPTSGNDVALARLEWRGKNFDGTPGFDGDTFGPDMPGPSRAFITGRWRPVWFFEDEFNDYFAPVDAPVRRNVGGSLMGTLLGALQALGIVAAPANSQALPPDDFGLVHLSDEPPPLPSVKNAWLIAKRHPDFKLGIPDSLSSPAIAKALNDMRAGRKIVTPDAVDRLMGRRK